MSKSQQEQTEAPDEVFGPSLTEVQAQAVLMRAEGATYARIAEELEVTEEQAREYAPFPAQVNAGLVRDEMRTAIVMGDRNKLAEAYEQHGVTFADVMDQHRECLYAKQYFWDKETGNFFVKPDFKTRMTAVNSYWRAMGVIGEATQENDQAKPVELHMHRDTVYKVEQLTGRKIVKETKEDDGPEQAGIKRVGAGSLPRVRTVSEQLPEVSGGSGPQRNGDAGGREQHNGRAQPSVTAGPDRPSTAAGPADTDDWGDF